MGQPKASAADAEKEAREACRGVAKAEPDRVTQL